MVYRSCIFFGNNDPNDEGSDENMKFFLKLKEITYS
jgi:hypothetical protein